MLASENAATRPQTGLEPMTQTKNQQTKRESSVKPSPSATKGRPRLTSQIQPPASRRPRARHHRGARRRDARARPRAREEGARAGAARRPRAVLVLQLPARGVRALRSPGRRDRRRHRARRSSSKACARSAPRARASGQWALLDYGDFVVHVFLHSAREHYDLEGLWNDAPRIPLEVPPDARLPAGDAYDAAH